MNIWTSKNSGGIHYKPTVLIIDLTRTCQRDLATRFLPFIYDFVMSLLKIRMPLEIFIVRGRVDLIRRMSTSQPEGEWQRILNHIQMALKGAELFKKHIVEGVIKQSLQNLNAIRQGQKAILLLSNSLHLLSAAAMSNIHKICQDCEIKFTPLTFLKYSSLPFEGALSISLAFGLSPLLSTMYDRMQHPSEIIKVCNEIDMMDPPQLNGIESLQWQTRR